ncbi:hypothetical protein A6R68_01885, partial [Neotoma lepida]
MFAIEEINRNYILPNTFLGFEIHNVPHGQRYILANLFRSFPGPDYSIPNYRCARESISAAVLTGPPWEISEYIGTLLDLYKLPQITFRPFDSILSEQRRLYSLYQVASKDTSLTLSRGSFLTTSWKNQLQIIKSSANVIIIYGDTDSLLSLIANIKQKLLTWKLWVLNSHCDHSKSDSYFLIMRLIILQIFIQTTNPSKFSEDIYLHVLSVNKCKSRNIYSKCARAPEIVLILSHDA